MNKNKLLRALLISHVAVFSCSIATATHTVEAGQELSEFDRAITLKPNIDNGRILYQNCVACHGPEGWGTSNGAYPQIAGQLKSVTIKQLADTRAGNRDAPTMRAFATLKALVGAQEIADLAGYIANLPMQASHDMRHRRDLDFGKQIYLRDCADCHGEKGEGDDARHMPMIQGQHYQYLVRQYRWIRNGRRRNADKEMVKQIQGYSPHEEDAVLAYTSTLNPPKEKLAKPGWTNPDFPNFYRGWVPEPPKPRRGRCCTEE